MKTTTLKVVISTIVTGAIIAVATTKIAADYIDLMAIGISYTTVAVMIALAVADQRSKVKDYAGR